MKKRERGDCLLVVSDDSELCARIEDALRKEDCLIRVVEPALVKDRVFWRAIPKAPGAILLDLDDDLDWAVGVLHDIKRAHIRSPLIVVSREPNEEFGMKIVSVGISYFLLRDFDAQELCDVVKGLIKPSESPLN